MATGAGPQQQQPVWVRVFDPNGHSQDGAYYWNTLTGECLWHLPVGHVCLWSVEHSPDGKPYYWHSVTRETTWAVPQHAGGAEFAAQAAQPPPPSSPPPFASVLPPGVVGPPAYQRPPTGWVFATWKAGPRVQQPIPADGAPRRTESAGLNNWVEVATPFNPTYYWNLDTGTTARVLPREALVKWRTHWSEEQGKYYYQDFDTGETTWEPPNTNVTVNNYEDKCAEVDGSGQLGWIQVGAAMAVTGLRYNGQVVEVYSFDNKGTVSVALPDVLGGTILNLRPSNLVPLKQGTLVQLRNLQRQPELNHVIGVIESVVPDFRYMVQIAQSDGAYVQKIVKPTRMLPRCRLWDLDLTKAPEWLSWRDEQHCIFVDNSGQHRRYAIQFPLGFKTAQQDGGDVKMVRWPVLVFMNDLRDAAKYLLYVFTALPLENVSWRLLPQAFARIEDQHKAWFWLVGLFELGFEALLQELGETKAMQARLIFYQDLRRQHWMRPWDRRLRRTSRSSEAAMLDCLLGLGKRPQFIKTMKDFQAADLASAHRWSRVCLGATYQERRGIAVDVATVDGARRRPPSTAEFEEFVWLSWRMSRPWEAAVLVSGIAAQHRGDLALQRMGCVLLLAIWRRTCRTLAKVTNHEDDRQRLEMAQRLLIWTSKRLDREAPFWFRAGAGGKELVALLPRRSPRHVSQVMVPESASPLRLKTQLECCAWCIERDPVHSVAWRLLVQVLCDERGVHSRQMQSLVREVWAPPRWPLWARLFYVDPAPARLQLATPCVRRALVFLFAHFPNAQHRELAGLLQRLPDGVAAAAAASAGGNSVEEVPPSILRHRLQQLLANAAAPEPPGLADLFPAADGLDRPRREAHRPRLGNWACMAFTM